MELPQSNTLLPVCSYTLYPRTKISLLSLSTVDRLKDLNTGYLLPRRHRSSRGVKRKKQNLHSFIVASFNAQSVKDNDMACKHCEYKSFLGSNITLKTNCYFTHTSFEVVQASITLQHNTLHFSCLYRPPPNRRNNLTDSMFTEQLPDLLDYVNNLPGFVCLVGDMNIQFDNPLQSLTKQTLITLCLYDLVQVIKSPLTGVVISLTGLLFDLTMTSIKIYCHRLT